MFGYLRMTHASHEHKKVYKNYYCGLCFAMQRNYGQLSRFLISYDLVLIGLLIKPHKDPTCERLPCFGKRTQKQQFLGEEWKKVAAVNLLLTAGQFRDNIEDENSLLAKIFFRIYSNKIKKAQRDFPEMYARINAGYERLLAAEKAKRSVIELSASFSVLMENVYRCIDPYGDAREGKTAYIKAIAGWLYFIDQLDDYQKDIDKGRFNPLIMRGVSGKEYIEKHFQEIHKLICHYYRDIQDAVQRLPLICIEDELLRNLAINTIPSMTAQVLNRNKAPKLRHLRSGMVWSNI